MIFGEIEIGYCILYLNELVWIICNILFLFNVIKGLDGMICVFV